MDWDHIVVICAQILGAIVLVLIVVFAIAIYITGKIDEEVESQVEYNREKIESESARQAAAAVAAKRAELEQKHQIQAIVLAKQHEEEEEARYERMRQREAEHEEARQLEKRQLADSQARLTRLAEALKQANTAEATDTMLRHLVTHDVMCGTRITVQLVFTVTGRIGVRWVVHAYEPGVQVIVRLDGAPWKSHEGPEGEFGHQFKERGVTHRLSFDVIGRYDTYKENTFRVFRIPTPPEWGRTPECPGPVKNDPLPKEFQSFAARQEARRKFMETERRRIEASDLDQETKMEMLAEIDEFMMMQKAHEKVVDAKKNPAQNAGDGINDQKAIP